MRHDALPPRPAATRLALALALAFLASCGGGVDSGGTGTTVGYAAGPITGFGSVIVNGVRYDERSAEIRDDDERLRSSADLRLGMLTEIVASAPVSTAGGVVATASALHYRSQLIGPVERVDAAAGRLTVLGQAVRITASTVIDSALAGGVAALAPGDVVEVYAQYDSAAASHVATRVQRAGDVRSYKLRGPVAALSLSDRTLTVGTLVISYAAVAPADPATTLAVGQRLRIRLATAPVGAVWQATAISAADTPLADREFAEVEGRITRYTSAADFAVDDLPVDARSASFPDGRAGLALGARVEVEGRIAAGTLVANKVKVEGDDDEGPEGFELHGAISAANSTARTFVVRGVTVAYDDTTTFEDGDAGDIADGRQVEVRGALSTDGTELRATTIHVEK